MKRVQSNLKRFSQSPVPDVLHKYLVSNYSGANYFSVYEAGFCGIWIHEKHQSGKDTYNSGNEGNRWAKSGIALCFCIKYNI